MARPTGPAMNDAESDGERIARLEERVGVVHSLVMEIRSDQKELAEVVARASGGLRVLMLLGGVAGAVGALRGLGALLGGWVLPHGH
jgi:hypothetical protein